MQIGQLRCFLAVAEQRHFTRAARQLGVAQPSVSALVRRLEADIGSQLFHRTKGHIGLTAAGEALLPYARRIVADADAARTQLEEVGGLVRGRLAIGATPSLTASLVPPVLAHFHTAHPRIELALREAGSEDLVDAVEEGVVDVALVILPVRQEILATEALLHEELVLAVAPSHALARRMSIAVAELRGVPLVMFREGYDLRTATETACRAAGFAPAFAIEGGEMDGVLRLTAAGLGAAIVPSIVMPQAPELRAVRIAQPALTRTIGLAHRRDRRLSSAAEELVGTIRTVVRDRSWLATPPPGLMALG